MNNEILQPATIGTENGSQADSCSVGSAQQSMAFLCHELRNPLTSLLAMIDRLKLSASTEQLEILNQADVAGEHMKLLLNGVLDWQRLENGSLELSRESFDLLDTVFGAVRMTAMSKAAGRQVSVAVGDRVPRVVVGDALRLKQVLINLVSNAVKFTPADGTVTVLVEWNKEQLLISVVDTGIGMDESARERLFLPYSQAEGIGRAFGGTGLGLYLTRKLVTLMGGTIDVESEPGSGSAFHVHLPLVPESREFEFVEGPLLRAYRESGTCLELTPSQPPVDSGASWPSVDRSKSNVGTGVHGVVSPESTDSKNALIVDDDPLVLNCVETALGAAGFRCREACTANQALELAREETFDVIVVDGVVGSVSGTELGRQLLEIQAQKGKISRLIGISGFNMSSEFQAIGAAAFLLKPFTLLSLVEAASGS